MIVVHQQVSSNPWYQIFKFLVVVTSSFDLYSDNSDLSHPAFCINLLGEKPLDFARGSGDVRGSPILKKSQIGDGKTH